MKRFATRRSRAGAVKSVPLALMLRLVRRQSACRARLAKAVKQDRSLVTSVCWGHRSTPPVERATRALQVRRGRMSSARTARLRAAHALKASSAPNQARRSACPVRQARMALLQASPAAALARRTPTTLTRAPFRLGAAANAPCQRCPSRGQPAASTALSGASSTATSAVAASRGRTACRPRGILLLANSAQRGPARAALDRSTAHCVRLARLPPPAEP